MKNLTIILSFFLIYSSSISAQAPSYTFFEWDIIGVGAVIPTGNDDLGTGISCGAEVRFNITNDLSIGLGSDVSFFNLKTLENLEKDQEATIGLSSTGYISADYYLNRTSSKRGFVGLALGATDFGDIKITGGTDATELREGESGMSIAPRVGYEFGHVRFLAYYNIGLEEQLKNYLGLKFSLTLWGGYKG